MKLEDRRYWVALVTFERRTREQDILPEWADGACGWMAVLAQDQDEARHFLVRDIEHHGLRVVEIANEQEVFSANDVEEFDEHLGANFRNIEPGKQTIWGTIQGYKGDGEA